MLQIIKNLMKFIQVLSLLTIPFIVLYWVLVQANLESFLAIQALMSLVIDPIINTIGSFYSYNMIYEGQQVDMTAFVAVFVLLGLYLICNFIVQLVEGIECRLREREEIKKLREEEETKAKIHQNYIRTLQNKKITFLATEFNKNKSNISYLMEETSFDGIKAHIDKIINCAKNYHGRIVKETSGKDKEFYLFCFGNHEDAINFSFYIQRNLTTTNSDMAAQGYSITYKGLLDCADSEGDIPVASGMLEKMISVADVNKMISTSIFMQKYSQLGEDKKIKFFTKGKYSIKNKKCELFDIKKGY